MVTSCFAMLHYCFDVVAMYFVIFCCENLSPLFHWCFVLVSLEKEMFWLF